MMAPPGALFLSFSRFLRAFFSTGLESAYFPCVCRFASRFADGISKILSFFLSLFLSRLSLSRFRFSLLFLSSCDFVQTGVAALRSRRSSNTTLITSEREDEDEESSSETDEEDEESSFETDEEHTRVKKKQRVGLINEEKTGKRKRKETKKKEKTKTEKEIEAIETAFTKIDVKVVLKEAKEKANNLNFKEGMGDYVALVVLSMGKAAGVPKMSANAISEMADELGLRGKRTGGKVKQMSRTTIHDAMLRDTTNFTRNKGGTFSLADELEEKTKTEKEIEVIQTAFAKIDVKGVLKEAKEKANNLNFKEGMGDYVALVVLSMGKAAGVPKMSANAISEMADELGLRGNKKMSENTITSAISRSTTTNFLHHEGEGKYSVADELKKKKKTKKEAKSDHPVVHVKRGEWDLKKFEDVGFYGNENKWCPLCDGRTVVNVSYVMFYSHEFLVTRTKEVLIERYGNEIKREQVNKVLDYYFEEKLKTGPRRDIKNFDTVCRESEEVCWHCWTKLREWLKSEWLKR